MSSSFPHANRPYRFRLQFSLASVFILTTLISLGAWYWYQWPFAVESKLNNPSADPFGQQPLLGVWPSHEVEFVRRGWGGKTVRHGPRRVYYSNGNLLSVENYRNGQQHGEYTEFDLDGMVLRRENYVRGELHGPSRRWNSNGELHFECFYDHGLRHGRFDDRDYEGNYRVEAFFERGRPVGKWTWYFGADGRLEKPCGKLPAGTIVGHWRDAAPDGRWEWRSTQGALYLVAEFRRGKLIGFESDGLSPRLLEALVMACSESPDVLHGAFDPARISPRWNTLGDIAVFSQDMMSFPIVVEMPNLESSGISLDSAISFLPEGTPFLLALNKLLATYGLGCDYRYGVLFIDTLSSISDWHDTTGVMQLVPPSGSQLEEEWNKPTSLDVIEMPLNEIVSHFCKMHRISIDVSLPSQPVPQTPEAAAHYLPVTPATPLTLRLKGISFKNALATLLSDLDCKATLQDDTLIIEPIGSDGARRLKPQPIEL